MRCNTATFFALTKWKFQCQESKTCQTKTDPDQTESLDQRYGAADAEEFKAFGA